MALVLLRQRLPRARHLAMIVALLVVVADTKRPNWGHVRSTAPMAGIPGYRVGGKTGTAQVINPDCGCYDGSTIGSFIGMAPIEAPELVIGVTIVRPTIQQLGGELAGPVFREVMTYALQARRVAPVTPADTADAASLGASSSAG